MNNLKRAPMRIQLLAFLVVSAAAAAASADENQWTTYQGDVSHNAFIDLQIINVAEVQTWTGTMLSSVDGMAIADGIAFVNHPQGSGSEQLVAFDVATGNRLWTKSFQSFSVNQPTYSNGVVWLQTGNHSGDTWLRAYTATDGNFRYRSALSAQWENYLAPIVVGTTILSQAGTYGGLYAHDTATGDLRWFRGLPQYHRWTPTPWEGSLVCLTNQVDLLTLSDGNIHRSFAIPNFTWTGYSVEQAPVVSQNNIHFTNGGRLYSMALPTGVTNYALPASAAGQVVVDGEEVFFIGNGVLTVRDRATGGFLWAWEPPGGGSLRSPFVVTRDTFIVSNASLEIGTPSYATYVVSRTEPRQIRAQLPLAGKIAIGDGYIVIGESVQSSAARVMAFRTITTALMASGFE